MSTVLEKNTLNISEIKRLISSIEAIQPISSTVAPQLPTHIQAVKNVCANWSNNSLPELEISFKLISTLVGDWNSNYEKELTALVQANNFDKTQFTAVLQKLQAQAASTKASTLKSGALSKADDSNLASAIANINSDSTKISSQASADQQTINDLNAKIAHSQSKINDYRRREKIYRWIPGMGWIMSALDKLISNVKGYQDQVNSYTSAERNEQNEIKQLQAVIPVLSNTSSTVKIVSTAFISLEDSLDSLSSNLTDIIGQIDSIKQDNFPVWIQAQIHTLTDDFAQVNAIATKINQ